MTPAELQERVDAMQRAEKAEWERTAWMVHHILSGLVGKDAPDVDELLGRKTNA